jgi:hypothetical protein
VRIKKRHVFTAVGLAVLLIAGGVAYAWISNTVPVSTANTITSGNMTATVQLSPSTMQAADLMPSVGYPNGGSYKTAWFAIQNTGNDPAYFRVQADLTAGDAALADKISMIVILQPNDVPAGWTHGEYGHPDFNLTPTPIHLSAIVGANSVLNNVQALGTTGFVPLQTGMFAVYKIVYWLDSSATVGGQSLTFDLSAHITQAVPGNSAPAASSF